MHMETAFLSELNGNSILKRLEEKVQRNEMLTDEELMEFIILPLSYRKKEERETRIRDVVDLAVKIRDKSQQVFTLAGILTFSDKIIDKETANKIRRAIEMTQVAMIFEEEKQQAIKQAVEQAVEDSERKIVVNMIRKGYPTDEILFLMPCYSKDAIEAIREKSAKEENN